MLVPPKKVAGLNGFANQVEGCLQIIAVHVDELFGIVVWLLRPQGHRGEKMMNRLSLTSLKMRKSIIQISGRSLNSFLHVSTMRSTS